MAFFRNLLHRTSANERSPSPSEKEPPTPTPTWREALSDIIGSDVKAVEVGMRGVLHCQPWYRTPQLLKLNFCILSLIMFCKYPAHVVMC